MIVTPEMSSSRKVIKCGYLPYIDPSDRPDHDYFPDNEEEREKDPNPISCSIVKVLNKMRSRNKSNRLEKHYYVPFEDDVTSGSTRMPLKTSKLCKILFNQSYTLIYGDFYC